MSYQYKIKTNTHRPGSRGGHFWVDDKGTIRYGIIPKKYTETIQQRAFQEWFHSEVMAGRLPRIKKPQDAKKVKAWWESTLWAQADREKQGKLFKGIRPKRPGIRGGKYWVDKKGNIVYGQRPYPKAKSAKHTDLLKSPNFKKWFGDWEKAQRIEKLQILARDCSKVVDGNGKPLRVYHGTGADFKKFDFTKIGEYSDHPSHWLGFFFTPDPKLANEFADRKKPTHNLNKYGEVKSVSGGNVMPVYLDIKNPLILQAKDFEYDLKMFQGIKTSKYSNRYNESSDYFGKITDNAIKDGHDGIIIKGDKKTTYPELEKDNYIVFNDNQIKSAIGNRGTYKKDYYTGGDITKSKLRLFKAKAGLVLMPSKKDPRKKRWQKVNIDPKEFKKHGIQEGATEAYQYHDHHKWTHEWRDTKDRLIRRYTPEYTEKKAILKFRRIERAIKHIPDMRDSLLKDSKSRDAKTRAVAVAIIAIDQTAMRVGTGAHNDRYGTYGATTLTKDHVTVKGDTVTFEYIGKKSKAQKHTVTDPHFSGLVKKLMGQGGEQLFSYTTNGETKPIKGKDINAYLAEYGITAKDIRTFKANVVFTTALKKMGRAKDEKQTTKNIIKALDETAEHLGNTRAVCKARYVSPQIIQAYYDRKRLKTRYLVKSMLTGWSKEEKEFIRLWNSIKGKVKKSHVKQHIRRTKSGKVATVREHQDSRTKLNKVEYLIKQTEIAAKQLMRNPKLKDYKAIIQRKIDAMKKNPTAKVALNVLEDLQTIAGMAKSLTFSGHKLQGRTTFAGMNISIENKAGSYRRGTDPDGHKWKTKLHQDYGYIRGTVGNDKDHVDCFIGSDPDSQKVYIIHQKDIKTGKYDEDKVMLGWSDKKTAVVDYLKNYDRKDMLGSVTTMTIAEFKKKAFSKKYKGKMIKAFFDEYSEGCDSSVSTHHSPIRSRTMMGAKMDSQKVTVNQNTNQVIKAFGKTLIFRASA